MKLENMDSMTVEELNTYKELLQLAIKYARWKSCAIIYRKQGIIGFAQDCENCCEKIYNQIPPESRW